MSQNAPCHFGSSVFGASPTEKLVAFATPLIHSTMSRSAASVDSFELVDTTLVKEEEEPVACRSSPTALPSSLCLGTFGGREPQRPPAWRHPKRWRRVLSDLTDQNVTNEDKTEIQDDFLPGFGSQQPDPACGLRRCRQRVGPRGEQTPQTVRFKPDLAKTGHFKFEMFPDSFPSICGKVADGGGGVADAEQGSGTVGGRMELAPHHWLGWTVDPGERKLPEGLATRCWGPERVD